jgi:hypothetical protein
MREIDHGGDSFFSSFCFLFVVMCIFHIFGHLASLETRCN